MTMPKFDPVAYRFTAPGITKLDIWPHGGKWHRLFTEDQLTASYEAGKRDAALEVEQGPVAFDYELLVDARGNGHYGFEHRLTYCHPSVHNSMVKNVRKLYAVPPSPPVPEGWKLVPIEPTEEMIDTLSAGLTEHFGVDASSSEFRRMYKTMLAAAPSPEGEVK